MVLSGYGKKQEILQRIFLGDMGRKVLRIGRIAYLERHEIPHEWRFCTRMTATEPSPVTGICWRSTRPQKKRLNTYL